MVAAFVITKLRDFVKSRPEHFLPTPLTMAPSLEEPTQVDLDAPLKNAPKLVAPEPGTSSHHRMRDKYILTYRLRRTLSRS